MTIAIIGGTGLTAIERLQITHNETLDTPYGQPSAAIVHGELDGKHVVFLARHGNPHRIPPHKINYRANLWALKQLGIQEIIAVAAVGGISSAMVPAALAVPDQIIDYSYGREHTFADGSGATVNHIDFSYPYAENLRQRMLAAAQQLALPIVATGTYGCTQGPRLETAAEIRRMAQDGCDLVGMTGMPEAALAKELDIAYANLSVVANWGAGLDANEITMAEIEANLKIGMQNAINLLAKTIQLSDG